MFIKATRFSVLFSGVCALILSMGIARYSLTPMIPHMQAQLDLTEGGAGLLAGLNYWGYLTGLFIVWLVGDLRVKDFFYRYGLFVAALATAVMAAHENPVVWYASRFFTGVASATGFMLGAGLILNWLHHNGYRQELGIHFSGLGLGIIVSALVVDLTGLDSLFAVNWRLQWVILAAVGFILFIPAVGLLPMPKADEIEMSRMDDLGKQSRLPSTKWLWLMSAAYFCAGFSNTLNVTFTSLITELQPLEGFGERVWLLVGVTAAIAPFIWDRAARRFGRLNSLKVAFAVGVLSNTLLASGYSLYTTILSASLFGFAFMGIVSLTLSTVGRLYGLKASQVMAQLTLGYCIAQILSPVMSGFIAEATGSFRLPLYIVSGIMLAGMICLLMLRNEHEELRHFHSNHLTSDRP
ncbi:MAG: YbfB/YjiJ family MFS transporter [Pseudomonadota bacterium]